MRRCTWVLCCVCDRDFTVIAIALCARACVCVCVRVCAGGQVRSARQSVRDTCLAHTLFLTCTCAQTHDRADATCWHDCGRRAVTDDSIDGARACLSVLQRTSLHSHRTPAAVTANASAVGGDRRPPLVARVVPWLGDRYHRAGHHTGARSHLVHLSVCLQ
jgi:hypothetical protein